MCGLLATLLSQTCGQNMNNRYSMWPYASTPIVRKNGIPS